MLLLLLTCVLVFLLAFSCMAWHCMAFHSWLPTPPFLSLYAPASSFWPSLSYIPVYHNIHIHLRSHDWLIDWLIDWYRFWYPTAPCLSFHSPRIPISLPGSCFLPRQIYFIHIAGYPGSLFSYLLILVFSISGGWLMSRVHALRTAWPLFPTFHMADVSCLIDWLIDGFSDIHFMHTPFPQSPLVHVSFAYFLGLCCHATLTCLLFLYLTPFSLPPIRSTVFLSFSSFPISLVLYLCS